MTSELKVYHVSSCPFSGGAARAGFRLHAGLMEHPEVDSHWLDSSPTANGPGLIPLKPAGKPILQRMKGRIRRRKFDQFFGSPIGPTPKSSPFGWGSIEMFRHLPKPDIWNLHWVSWMMDWEDLLPWMAEQAPIVWTLHDLNPTKGLWHYEPGSAERSAEFDKLETRAVEFKRNAIAKLNRDRICFVGPSRWMQNMCSESEVTSGFRTENIPYGLDTTTFAPVDATWFKKLFEVPNDCFVLGFVADFINDPRKGLDALVEAIKIIGEKKKIHLLTVGRQPLTILGLNSTHVGSIHSDRLMACFYSACDLFVCPSLQDNLPNTVLESVSCGTPVVGFDAGGIPDMVREGFSGLVAKPVGDAKSLADCILELSTRDAFPERSASCRELALKEYDSGVQANRYFDLYLELAGR